MVNASATLYVVETPLPLISPVLVERVDDIVILLVDTARLLTLPTGKFALKLNS
jgi:hypothetical protein